MTNETKTETNVVNLTIDGKEIKVPKGTTVYTAATTMGISIPIFCYQDRMPPFGACRVCMVEVEKMGKPQTSCTLEATEGMVVKTQTELAKKSRQEIIEFLLINHPLDCPICDRGGECPLQDQTIEFGPGYSRFYEEKRHFLKPISLGPVLKLDRERCIVCARCTRFGDLVAGDHALEFIERGFRTEVGTPDGGPAQSKFIGNTIQICPVGALTSDVYRFRARPWDNDSADSTCTLCSVGCSMILDSRDGEIMRTRSKENRDVNDIWLCDKGWFGYEFTSSPDRLKTPLIRRSGRLEEASWDEALNFIASKIREAKPKGKLAAFGGDPLTVEENYLFQKLMREGASVNNVDHRIGQEIFTLDQEGLPPGMDMSIGESEKLSYAILFGLDITEEFPIIWLRLKQAINHGATVIFVGNYSPEIAKHLSKTILHAPGNEIKMIRQQYPQIASLAEGGKKGALFVGRQYLSTANRKEILSELVKCKKSTPNLMLNLLEGRGNSVGARVAGMRPDLGPFGDRIQKTGLNYIQVLEEAAQHGWDFLYVAASDPAAIVTSNLWRQARAKTHCLVVQDLFLTETAREADVVLPALCYVEKSGSFINIEGRVQKLNPGKEIPEGIYSDGEIFTKIAELLNLPLMLDAQFLEKVADGRIIPFDRNLVASTVKESSPEVNGALYASFAPALFDRGVRMKHNPHVIELAKEPRVRIHPLEGKKRNVKEGDTVQLRSNGNAIRVKISLDEKVAGSTIVLPLGFEEVPVHDLGVNLLNGLPIEIAKL